MTSCTFNINIRTCWYNQTTRQLLFVQPVQLAHIFGAINGPPPGLPGVPSFDPQGLTGFSSAAEASGYVQSSVSSFMNSPPSPGDAQTSKALVDYTMDFESAGGNVIEMLRNLNVSPLALDILSQNSVNTPLAIMSLHDEGLTAISIKRGPRMLILNAVQSLTLPREDKQVKVRN